MRGDPPCRADGLRVLRVLLVVPMVVVIPGQ
jgi:hypothetical protein